MFRFLLSALLAFAFVAPSFAAEPPKSTLPDEPPALRSRVDALESRMDRVERQLASVGKPAPVASEQNAVVTELPVAAPTVQTLQFGFTRTCSGPNCPQQQQATTGRTGWYLGKNLGR